MTDQPLPKRRNPALRTRLAIPPPGGRSRIARGLTGAAAEGRFELQVCRDCGAVQYPPREACRSCLSDRLDWREADGSGELIAETMLHNTLELYFRARGPWRTGTVRLDSGVSLVAYVHRECAPAPSRVRVVARLDRAGEAVLVALPPQSSESLNEDPIMMETGCDPRGRKMLVTDAKSPSGQAMVHALVEAGAALVWAGYSEPWKKIPGFDGLSQLPQVTPVPLDVTNADSVGDLAGQIGGRVDILINTARHHRTHSLLARQGVETARTEMDVNCFGLMRLAQGFAPVMAARAGDETGNACAWVNLLSVFALSNMPAHGTFSASMAAALSLAQNLRAEMLKSGLRVINVFPGPVDDDWNQDLMPPKIAPANLARGVVSALRDGVEDVYPDPVAREWHTRWRDNPKVLERELAE